MSLDPEELEHEIELDVTEPEEEEASEAVNDELDSDTDDEEQDAPITGVDEPEEDESEALTVSFGDDSEEADDSAAPEWARETRRKNREHVKEIRDLKAKLEAQNGEQKQAILGPKPTLEGSAYDEDAHAEKLGEWLERKREVDNEASIKAKADDEANAEWQARFDGYTDKKRVLSQKVQDFDDAEDEVKAIFSPARQGMMLDAVKAPEIMVYALGKNPKQAQKLMAIKNDVQFIAELARMEKDMKVSGVKKTPAPEKRVGSKGGVAKSPKVTLERLEAEADKTGDRSKIVAFKRRQRSAQ